MKKDTIKNYFMSNFKQFVVFGLISLTFFIIKPVNAQNGSALFDDLCADCHSIGDGVYFGPDLMGVEGKRKTDWLLKFIKSSKSMIAAGDAQSVALFEQYKSKKMPDTDTSDEEIKAILVYIKSLNKNSTTVSSVKTETSKESSTETETSKESSTETETSEGSSEERISAIEKKLDNLLDIQARQEEKEILPANISNGKLLFTGKKAFVNGAPNCASCHYLNEIDTVNWNPSAYELATTYSRENGFDLTKLLRNPSSKLCKELFKDHELTTFEIFDIKAFLLEVAKTGVIPKKSTSNVIWYILLALLCLVALIDMLFIQIVNRKITLTVFLIGTGFIGKALYYEASNIGITQNYQPEQPIKFSHRIHAGENKIQCLYCHYSAEYSKTATIPSTDICMGCHSKIKSGKNSGTFEINKIYKAMSTGKPVKWIKIHNLPDHVFYSHAQHVGAGQLECKTCHGRVEGMDQVKQISPLTMGWCLDCHRTHKVNFDNKYYGNYKQLHESLKSGEKDFITVKDIGGEDCQKCHY